MYDRSLGYILTVIFGVTGLLLLVLPIVAPDALERTPITFVGGVLGVGLAFVFSVTMIVRKRCRKGRDGQPDESCAVDTTR